MKNRGAENEKRGKKGGKIVGKVLETRRKRGEGTKRGIARKQSRKLRGAI